MPWRSWKTWIAAKGFFSSLLRQANMIGRLELLVRFLDLPLVHQAPGITLGKVRRQRMVWLHPIGARQKLLGIDEAVVFVFAGVGRRGRRDVAAGNQRADVEQDGQVACGQGLVQSLLGFFRIAQQSGAQAGVIDEAQQPRGCRRSCLGGVGIQGRVVALLRLLGQRLVVVQNGDAVLQQRLGMEIGGRPGAGPDGRRRTGCNASSRVWAA